MTHSNVDLRDRYAYRGSASALPSKLWGLTRGSSRYTPPCVCIPWGAQVSRSQLATITCYSHMCSAWSKVSVVYLNPFTPPPPLKLFLHNLGHISKHPGVNITAQTSHFEALNSTHREYRNMLIIRNFCTATEEHKLLVCALASGPPACALTCVNSDCVCAQWFYHSYLLPTGLKNDGRQDFTSSPVI